jgi:hypothetical protein
MPHFWTTNDAGEWGMQPLDREYSLGVSAERVVRFALPAGGPGLDGEENQRCKGSPFPQPSPPGRGRLAGRPLASRGQVFSTDSDVLILPPDGAGVSPSWTLLAGRGVALRVNGQPLILGIRALRDRDEISIAGQRCFFSTEELARVVTCPGLAQPAWCPRCKQQVEPRSPAVACPHCRAWHHESEKFPCWSYEPTCALCQLQPTALDAGYSWTPEML